MHYMYCFSHVSLLVLTYPACHKPDAAFVLNKMF